MRGLSVLRRAFFIFKNNFQNSLVVSKTVVHLFNKLFNKINQNMKGLKSKPMPEYAMKKLRSWVEKQGNASMAARQLDIDRCALLRVLDKSSASPATVDKLIKQFGTVYK